MHAVLPDWERPARRQGQSQWDHVSGIIKGRSQRLTIRFYDRPMAQTLDEHHRQIAAGIAEVREHCSRPIPDIAALSTARLRLSRTSAARSQYVRDVLFPKLRAEADDVLLTQLDDMQRAFAAKRLASSEHVTTWSSKAIAEDWEGYRQAARRIWAMMEEQMDRERRIFG